MNDKMSQPLGHQRSSSTKDRASAVVARSPAAIDAEANAARPDNADCHMIIHDEYRMTVVQAGCASAHEGAEPAESLSAASSRERQPG